MDKTSSYKIRKIILDQSMRAHVGHIGSALSVADIIFAIYEGVLDVSNPDKNERDRFILSKGHAALALYAALFLKGLISEECLDTYCSDASMLGVHPECLIPGVDFSSGSLGHGLSIGAGAALAGRLQGSKRKVFVLISDGECNEGSLWEAVMFAAHHRLSNLVAVIDLNGQQAFGYTEEVLSLSGMSERWKAFKWDVHELDGHNIEQIKGTISGLDKVCGQPHVLIARTEFGKGVSFMEGQVKWHYLPMSLEQYRQALKEIAAKI